MSILIKCPRLSIEPSTPADFSAELNQHPDKKERREMAILSCMMALVGSAKCRFARSGTLFMQSEVGALLLAETDGQISITEVLDAPTPDEPDYSGDGDEPEAA